MFAGFGLTLRETQCGWELSGGRARPGEFHLRDRLAGISATCLALVLAAAIEGRTVIREANIELEVLDVVECVRASRTTVEVDRTTLVVEGPMARSRGTFRVPVDHLYCGTIAIAAGLTRGEVLLAAECRAHLPAFIGALTEAGFEIFREAEGLRVRAPRRPASGSRRDRAVSALPDRLTSAHDDAGDAQAGSSCLVEHVYAHRFEHAAELCRMGAAIQIQGNIATVTGPTTLRRAPSSGPAFGRQRGDRRRGAGCDRGNRR